MIDRRTFLRGAGAVLALPALAESQERATIRRMVAIQTNQGILPQFFFPTTPGKDYEATPYLKLLEEHRNDITVFSGVCHPQVDGGGHQAEHVFLTAAPHPGTGAFRNGVSLDQRAAESIGDQTRFPTLPLAVGGGTGLSYTRSGVMIPPEGHPGRLYERLFVQGSSADVERRIEDLRTGRSLLDVVADRASSFARSLGTADRDRVDQYLTSVRELERKLQSAEVWERRPKPQPGRSQPRDLNSNDVIGRCRLMFGLIRLALETDSTRLVTVFINMTGRVPQIPGVRNEVHQMTHHGNVPETIAELRLVEEAQFRVLSEFLSDLRGASLLDSTMVLYGTCMGSAASHVNTNLPVLLAGGGFKHRGHLAFDRQKNYPLPNLYVSMLQRLGVETDRFATSTGTMRGLETA